MSKVMENVTTGIKTIRPEFVRSAPMIGPVDGVYFDNYPDYLEAIKLKEREAFQSFSDYLDENHDLLIYVSRQGDGEGGMLIQMLRDRLFGADDKQAAPRYRKKKIDGSLRTSVFERDMYRCVKCGTHKELSADHIYPEALGGETTFENLQTMCMPCNRRKGTKTGDFQALGRNPSDAEVSQ